MNKIIPQFFETLRDLYDSVKTDARRIHSQAMHYLSFVDAQLVWLQDRLRWGHH